MKSHMIKPIPPQQLSIIKKDCNRLPTYEADSLVKIIMLPSFCILLHSGGRHLHILYNVCFRVFYIQQRKHHKCRRTLCTIVQLFVRPCSLPVLMRNIWLHTPCLTECTEPSFSHHLPANRQMRNDYKLLHSVHMHLCNSDVGDNLS